MIFGFRGLHLFGDFALDRARGCLMRGAEPIHLRPQAYEVLKYLAENRGRLVSKDSLIEEVWRGRAVTDDSLVQCLRDVRQALGPDGGQRIRNVRGRGYIFEGDGTPGGSVPPVTAGTDRVDVVRVVVEEQAEGYEHLNLASLPAVLLLLALMGGAAVAYRYLSWASGGDEPQPTGTESSRDLRLATPAVPERVAIDSLRNPAAYQLYLKGRHYTAKVTLPQILKGIALLQEAIATDNRYAPAHAALADAYRKLPIAYNTAPAEAFPKARAAARKALELDPQLAEPYVALGWIAFWYDWNWAAAERNLTKAIALEPNGADAYRAYAHLLSNLGQHAQALAVARRATELDPVRPMITALEAQYLFYADRLDEAAGRFHEALEIEPDLWVALNGLGRISMRREMYPEAIAVLNQAVELSAGSAEPMTQLGYALGRAGRREEARSMLKSLGDLERHGYVPAYDFAMIHLGLGETEAALTYLERALERREVQMTFIKVDRRWDGLRGEPRFAYIARRMNLE